MITKIPILLSYYALSNGNELLVTGQLTYSRLHDMSFRDYGRRRTFLTLLALYQTRPYANQNIELKYDYGSVKTKTDPSGAFFVKTKGEPNQKTLQQIILDHSLEVKILDGLYLRDINYLNANIIVVSDIDDTLIDSFILNKIRKFRTLMFTSVEKRRAVTNMQKLINDLIPQGATPIYLSNSEQNLYPLIYRFLSHNNFPTGPIFLKRLRKLWDILKNIKTLERDIHKVDTLKQIITLFPEKKFVLIGDNTQHDLQIYIETALKFPGIIKYIIIRKVIEKDNEMIIEKAREELSSIKTILYYATDFPSTFEW